MSRHPVTVSPDGVITVPHIGITLRVLLDAAAGSALTNRRRFRIQYKGSIIGEVRVRRESTTQSETSQPPVGEVGDSQHSGNSDTAPNAAAVPHLADAGGVG